MLSRFPLTLILMTALLLPLLLLLLLPTYYSRDRTTTTTGSSHRYLLDDRIIPPLQNCEGNCDPFVPAFHCDRGLICLERESFDPVPGCRDPGSTYGQPGALIASSINFCVRVESLTLTDASTSTSGTSTTMKMRAKNVGHNGNPPEVFPLQRCQADCDNDQECDTGLICYQRDATVDPKNQQIIPGCINHNPERHAGLDFCVLKTESVSSFSPPPLTVVVNITYPLLGPTESESQSGTPTPSSSSSFLVAKNTQAPTFPPSMRPTNRGTPPSDNPAATNTISNEPTATSNPMIITAAPTWRPTVQPTTSFPSTTSSTTNEPTLEDSTVAPTWRPTVLPSDVPTTDSSTGTNAPTITTAINNSPPSIAPSSSSPPLPDAEKVGNDGLPTNVYPLQNCQADCDTDKECDSGLICYQRSETYDPIPGCNLPIGGTTDGWDFCVSDPTSTTMFIGNNSSSSSSFPVATVIGNNDDIPESALPLKLCQGDCDEDWDCEFPLICYQRDRSNDPVPGCSVPLDRGSSVGSSDFCVPSQRQQGAGRTNSNILEGAFRLRLYWQEGYVWQESTKETFWCASTNYKKDRCWYGREGRPCRSDQMYLTRCGGTSVSPEQQAFIFVPLSNNNTSNSDSDKNNNSNNKEEVLIQVANRDDLRCWERDRRVLLLRTCDPTNPLQRWIATSGTSFFNQSDNRFEISQIGYERQCVSNDHHPKEAEAVELHSCIYNRSPESQTAFWERF